LLDSKTIAIGLIVIAAFSLMRIFSQWRGMSRKRVSTDWDERFIQQLRKAGVGGFEEQAVDFFFTVPAGARRDPLVAALSKEGYAVDIKQASDSSDFSVHVQRTMRLAVPEMQALRVQFTALAAQHGATYDNWAVGTKKQV
jgi:hypothetical protein